MSINIGQIETLTQRLHAVEESLAEINSQREAIRAELIRIMSEGVKSHRSIWGLVSLKAGRKTKSYESEKILKWESMIAAEKARLDKLNDGRVTITVGSPTVSFTKSR